MVTSTIMAHSVNPNGQELISFLWKYPLMIHAEIMTHRAFSRNAASSRAIPFRVMKEAIMINPAIPERIGKEQKGMQSGDTLSDKELGIAHTRIHNMLGYCVTTASCMHNDGVHKSIVNRYLAPWLHITVLVTTARPGLVNFFAQRAHKDAEPTFQVLAYRALHQYLRSVPEGKDWGEWHIPNFAPLQDVPDDQKIRVATARCARLSYLTHDGRASIPDDLALCRRLSENNHWSPFEHCAQAEEELLEADRSNFDVGNLAVSGWRQFRKMFVGELQEPNLDHVLANKPDWITL